MRVVFAFIGILLAGCVSNHDMTTAFDPSEAAYINEQGTNTIKGQAFLRRNDGIVVYAAGSKVDLVPVTRYATERIQAIYGDRNVQTQLVKFNETDPNYVSMVRQTVANGEGRFSFEDVADGRYYLITNVTWMAGDVMQGGSLKFTVDVNGGETREVIMNGQ